MAFGFNDFAKFFDPVSDLLGTSGKQGVGLLQQKPEDIAMTAAAVYLATNGIPVTPESLAAAETVTATGTAEAAATQEATRLAAEQAAQEAAKQGILQAKDASGSFLERFGVKGVDLNPAGAELPGAPYGTEEPTFIDKLFGRETGAVRLEPTGPQYTPEDFGYQGVNQYTGRPIVEGTSLNPFPGGTENIMSKTMAHAPNEVNALDYSSQIGFEQANSPAFQEYQLNQAQQAGAKLPEVLDKPFNPNAKVDYGLNYTKSLPPEVGTESNYRLNQSSFRSPGDTNLSASLPQSQTAGINNPTANVGNRLPYTEGDYTQTESALDKGMRKAGEYFDKTSDYVDKNPYKSAGLAYYGAYKTGMLDQEPAETPADNYKNPYSMRNFRRADPNPGDYQYRPSYAQGGIASIHSYKKGGRSKTEAAMDFYDAMNPQPAAPLKHGDPGIYYDADPDTRYLDPMEAAMVRMSKLNSRTNVQAPTMTPNRRMGELDFKPVAAAQGGIMGYAEGGDIPTYYEELIRLNNRGGGGRTKEGPDAKFSPTSEGAAAVSKLGQKLSAISPLVSVFAPVAGAIASSYGDHMARNVDPNYSHEGRASLAQDGRIAAFDAMRSNEGVNSVTPGGESSDASPVTGNPGTGREGQHAAQGGIMGYNLGGYAAGGNPRLLRGPGDGMSDHIPATINNRQPARLADGEYVITADVVSHLGNGSTEAGARQLDAMMKRIRKGRTGTPKQGKQINPRKYLPA